MSQRFVWMLGLGAACGALGCSDPVPAAAAAGLNVRIGICPTQGMSTATLGNPPPDRTRAQGSAAGRPIYNGESGASISCSVRGESVFTVSGRVSAPGLSFEVEGTANAGDGKGTALITLYTPGIGQHVSQQNCTLDVVRTSVGLQLQSGAIWSGFTCSGLTAPPSLTCNASGEFLLERCGD